MEVYLSSLYTRSWRGQGQIYIYNHLTVGRDSSVSIATYYGLDGPGIESRWGSRFSAPVQTRPEAHSASCTMGTGSFPGGEEAGAWR